jgi:hypothetical protein
MPPEKIGGPGRGPQSDIRDFTNTTKNTTAARSSSFSRRPDLTDDSFAWRIVRDANGEPIGSIRRTSFGSYTAQDRRRNELGLAFASFDQALAALEGRQ